MNWRSKVVLIFSLVILGLSTVACEKEGDAEKAGKAIDKAFDKVKEKVHDATE